MVLFLSFLLSPSSSFAKRAGNAEKRSEMLTIHNARSWLGALTRRLGPHNVGAYSVDLPRPPAAAGAAAHCVDGSSGEDPNGDCLQVSPSGPGDGGVHRLSFAPPPPRLTPLVAVLQLTAKAAFGSNHGRKPKEGVSFSAFHCVTFSALFAALLSLPFAAFPRRYSCLNSSSADRTLTLVRSQVGTWGGCGGYSGRTTRPGCLPGVTTWSMSTGRGRRDARGICLKLRFDWLCIHPLGTAQRALKAAALGC